MNKKKSLTKAFMWGILILGGICVLVRFAIDVSFLWEAAKEHPLQVPIRDVISEDFSPLWSKEIGESSQHLVHTQILAPDDKSIIYITPNSMNSIDLSTGAALWTTNVPEVSTFHFYHNKIFSLDSYDNEVPFVSTASISIPSKCSSHDPRNESTLRVYNPHTGKKEWEYSYQMVIPDRMSFKDNSAFTHGLTIGFTGKYISIFEIDIDSGQILGVECQNYNNYSSSSADDDILSSSFYPITRDWEWKTESDNPAFIVEGSKLIRVDRQTKNPISQIEFTGFPLKPNSTQLIISDDILIVYLDDSNQFFAFQVK